MDLCEFKATLVYRVPEQLEQLHRETLSSCLDNPEGKRIKKPNEDESGNN